MRVGKNLRSVRRSLLDIGEMGNGKTHASQNISSRQITASEINRTASSNIAFFPLPSMNSVIGQQISCTLNDGRIITGRLVCLDRLRNLVLTGVVEERVVLQADYANSGDAAIRVRRELSQAMVPGSRLEKVEVERHIFDRMESDRNST
jgi:small nuclear ribonucleoprotein (snRNP)-like protein